MALNLFSLSLQSGHVMLSGGIIEKGFFSSAVVSMIGRDIVNELYRHKSKIYESRVRISIDLFRRVKRFCSPLRYRDGDLPGNWADSMIFFSLQLNTFNKTFIHNVWLNQFNTPDTTLNEYTSIEHMPYPVELVHEKPHL